MALALACTVLVDSGYFDNFKLTPLMVLLRGCIAYWGKETEEVSTVYYDFFKFIFYWWRCVS